MKSPTSLKDIDPEHFCFYPFMQMLLQPTGVVSPCCWNQEVVLGVVPRDKLSDIWNGEVARGLRKEFLEGQPTSCAQQMRHIGCHRWSRRNYLKEIELAEIQTAAPVRFDVRLNGRCNLQCIMCDVWMQPNGLYDESDFWKNGPKDIFPYLREMDVLGGEPFVQADTFRLIDEVSAVNSNCSWAFVTNGHYKFDGPIRSRLDKIALRWLQVSLDSLDPETYSKIRVKGLLDRTLATIDALVRYRKEREFQNRGFKLMLSMCVQPNNWREISQLIDFAVERRIVPVLQFAYKPENTSLLSFERHSLIEVSNHFVLLAKKYGLEMLNPVLLPIKEALDRPSRQELQHHEG